MTLKTIEGTFIAPKGRYALVVGRFNSFVVESLVSVPLPTDCLCTRPKNC